MSRIWGVVPLLAVVVGCEPRLSPPPGAQLQCTASDQCPDGFVCREAIGRCVPADSLGNTTPPALVGTPAVAPALGKSGTRFSVSFEVTEALAETPVVTAEMKTETAAWTLDAAESSGNRYTFSYTATGSEPEGVVRLFVDLIDTDGNPAKGVSLPSVLLDFKAPELVSSTSSPSSAKAGDVLAYSVSASEKLLSAPTLVVKQNGTVVTDFFGAPTTATDSYFVWTKNIAGALDGDFTVEVSLVDEAGNAAGPLTGSAFSIDSTVPQLSGLTVTPRAKANDTVTVTFNVSEQLPANGVNVTVGSQPMSCGAYSSTAPNYTCTYAVTGNELGGANEATQTVLVKVADAAGNRAETLGTVTFDFKAPSIVSSTANPAAAKAGDVVVYTVNVSEKLQSTPVLLVKKGGVTQANFFGTTTTASDTSFTWAKTLSGSALDGTYTVEASLTDEAGNAATALTATGFSIDTTPPQLSALTVVTPRVKSGGTVTVTFNSSEALGATGVVATVGNSAMTCSAYQASAPNYSCTYAVTGSEITANTEAPQTVLVKLIDAAGNRAEAAGSVTFDFQAPSLITGTPSPTTAKANDTLRYSVNVSETLTGTPTVVVKKGGVTQANFFGAAQTLTPTNFVYSAVVGSQPDGDYTVEITLTDAAGNASAVLNGTGFSIDASVPTVTALTVSPSRVNAGDAVTVTFDSSENVAASGVSVSIGASAMSCDPYQAAAPNYTCRYTISATEIPAGSEVSRSVVVRVTDTAGNRGEAIDGIAIDFKAPALVSSAVNPQVAKQNDVVVYTVSVNEALASPPALVVRKGGVAQTGFFGAPSPSGTNYSWSRTINSSLDGDYTVEMTLTDEAGNSSAVLSGVAFSVDTTVPTVSTVLVSPDRVKVGGTVTVRFNSTEQITGSGVSATIGGFAMSCGAYQATPPNYTCTYTATGSETAANSTALESVLVKLVDSAGNRSEGTGSVTFDFQAPSVVSSASNPPIAKNGDFFVYTLNVSERLQSAPTPVVKLGGVTQAGFFGTPESASDTSYTWTKTITSGLDGNYDVEVALTDEAGNVSAVQPLSIISIDSTAPSISGLAVTAPRAKSGDTVTINFNTTDASASVVATVGSNTMTCGAYSATAPNYACTYVVTGSEIAANTEAPQTVLVKIVDTAGNRSEAASSVTFDFQAPSIISGTPSPSTAKVGDTLRYTVNVSEALSGTPTVVVKKGGVVQSGFFGAAQTQSATTFVFSAPIAAQPDGTYTVEISLVDSAGNASATLNGTDFSIDASVPTVTGLTVAPARVKAGDTVTATFNSSESVPATGVSVTIGASAMSCTAYQSASPNYTCSYVITASEIPANSEVSRSVVVKLTDSAGNRGEDVGGVAIDFKTPSIVSSAANPPAAKLNDVLTYTVNASETLAVASPPSIVVKKGGVEQPGFFGAPSSSGTNFSWSKTITSGLDGVYTVELTLTDEAGNVSSPLGASGFSVDATVPSLTALTISPSRVKAADTATVTFNSSEAGAVTATIGAQLMSCSAYSGTAPNYTCTYLMSGSEITANTEAAQTVLVKLSDAAGNRAETAGSITFDFKAPGIVSSSASPPASKSGDVLVYTVNVSEKLQGAPTLVVRKGGVEQPGFFAATATASDTSFTWTKTLASGIDGAYTVEASFTDEAGNAASAVAAAGFSVDSTVPAVSALTVSPERIRSTGTLTVQFDASEAVAPAGVTADVAGFAMSCGAYQSSSPNYTCTYAVTGSEITANSEASRSVLVKLVDAAGNRGEGVSSVVFDFKAPTLVSTSASPSTAKGSDTLTYTVNVSEALGGTPTLVVKKAGVTQSGFFGAPSTSSGTNYVWTKSLSSVGDGAFTVEATFIDEAGNASGTLAASGFSVDSTVPVASSLSISPLRARDGTEVTVTFDSSEELPVGGVVATAGPGTMSCDPYSPTAPNYTCRYTVLGNEITPGTEAPQTVLLRLVDASGNRSETAGTVVFDFKAPQVTSSAAAPPAAKGGDLLRYTVTVSEPLTGTPTVTVKKDGVTQAGFFTSQVTTTPTSFTFEVQINPQPDGAYTVEIDATDSVGNVLTAFGGVGFTIDASIPFVSNLSVTPDRVKAGDTVTATFNGAEDVGAAGVDVKVGDQAMTCTSYQATAPNYTCTRVISATEIVANSEQPRTVLARLTDAAGNRNEAAGNVLIDFKAPVIVSSAATPALAKNGDTLNYAVSFNEPLNGTPTLTVKKGGVEQTNFFAVAPAVSGNNYTWSKPNLPSGLDGSYTVEVFMTDKVGNSAGPIAAGGFALDTSIPVISNFTLVPLRLKAGQTVTATFDVSEPLPVSGIDARVGSTFFSCSSYSATPPNYTCTYTATGTEIAPDSESFQSVLVKVTDSAGNRGDAAGGVTYDFKAPTLSSAKASPSSVKSGETLVYSITVSEPITGVPALVVKRGGTEVPGFFGGPTSASGTNYVWTRAVSGADDGTYTVSMTFTDLVGNPSTVQTGDGFQIDATVPDISNVTLNVPRVRSGTGLIIEFNVSEPVNATVKVAGRPASCSSYSSSPPNFTCSYTVAGDEIPPGTEGTGTIQLTAVDAAGNDRLELKGLEFDFLPPNVEVISITPVNAKMGDTVFLRMNSTEPLNGASIVNMTKNGTPAAFFGGLTPDAPDSWKASQVVNTTLQNGDYSFKLSLVDTAGNVFTTFGFYNFRVDTNPPLVSSLSVSPARGRMGDVITVSFDVSPDVLDSEVAVRIGAVTPTCGARQASTPHFTCTYQLTGVEIPPGTEGAQTVSVEIADGAGNTAEKYDSVMLDFRPPAVALASVVYTPDPVKNRLTSASVARSGTKISVLVAADEDLDTSSVPVMTASDTSGATLTFSGSSIGTGSVLFEATVPYSAPIPPDGIYTPKIEWKDVVGNNTTTATFASPPIRVKTSTPALTVDQTQITFLRSPIGNGSPESFPPGSYSTSFGPHFSLAPANTLSASETLAASAFTMTNGTMNRLEVWADSAQTQLLGILKPNGDGSWPRKPLANVDTPTVWVSALDEAGNEAGSPQQIQTTEWVATPNAPPFGVSPHIVLANRFSEQSLPFASGAAESTTSAVYAFNDLGNSDAVNGNIRWESRPNAPWPTARVGYSAAFDSGRGRWVFFGGDDTVGRSRDVYEWDGVRWYNRTPNPLPPTWPQGRALTQMVYDAKRNRVVMFGGAGSSASLNDVWEWDGTNWSNRTPSTLPANWPAARYGHTFTYDSRNHRALMFGGLTSVGFSREVWQWDGAQWTDLTPNPVPAIWPSGRYAHGAAFNTVTQRLVLFGGASPTRLREIWEFDPSTATFANLTPSPLPASWPTARTAFAMTWDEARQVIFLFGGNDGVRKQDLWEWDGTVWTNRTPSPLPASWPTARQSLTAVYDHHRSVVAFYGGDTGTQTKDLWEWNGSALVDRTYVEGTGPGTRTNLAGVWDSSRGRFVLFGGNAPGSPTVYLGDTWEWDGNRWTDKTPTAPAVSPTVRDGHMMSFDSTRSRVLLFGGRPNGGAHSRELWEWNGTAWTNLTPGVIPASWPTARSDGAMVYDPVLGRTILFGGRDSTGVLSDFWEWNAATSTWASRAPSGTWPVAREQHAMVYDPARARTVLLGGSDSGGVKLNDSFTWNSATSSWSTVSLAGPMSVRSNPALAYDSSRARVVLYGGWGSGTDADDVWEWDGTTWSDKTPAVRPPGWPAARGAHAMAYDPNRARMVVHGGSSNGSKGETLELDARPTRTPAVTFVASAQSALFPAANITGMTVRGYCGGTGSPYTAAGNGADLEGWSVGGSARVPGEWVALATNSSGTNSTQPYLSATGNFLGWSAATAAEAKRFFMDRDGHLAFRCRSAEPSGVSPNDARVAVDYIEVRVRYTAP